MADDEGFVSFSDLGLRDQLALQERLLSLKDVAGANLLHVGSGVDASAELFRAAPQYEVEESAPEAPPRKEGWLHKEGHDVLAAEGKILGLLGSNWKRRYFVLSNGVLEYFERPDYSPKPWGTHQQGGQGSQTVKLPAASFAPLDSMTARPEDLVPDAAYSGDLSECSSPAARRPSTAATQGVHVPNAKGHIVLDRASLSDPKSARFDAKGALRPALRLDCLASPVAEYNRAHGGRLLLMSSINQSINSELLAATKGKGGDGVLASARRRLSGTGALSAAPCAVPSTHCKYVLAGESRADTVAWRNALAAHIEFASSERGVDVRRGLLDAREVVRSARVQELHRKAKGLPEPAESPLVARWRCDKPIVGPGTPAALCEGCGGDSSRRLASWCAVCGDDLLEHSSHGRPPAAGFIRAAAMCNECAAGHGAEDVCCRCEEPLFGVRLVATLCDACGGGAGAGRCCKLKTLMEGAAPARASGNFVAEGAGNQQHRDGRTAAVTTADIN